jgi:hypothetical protein
VSTPPEWVQVAGTLAWSTALTVAIFWQPRWVHRLFAQLVRCTDRLLSKRQR